MNSEDYVRKSDMSKRCKEYFLVIGGSVCDYPKEYHLNDYQAALEDFQKRVANTPWYVKPQLLRV